MATTAKLPAKKPVSVVKTKKNLPKVKLNLKAAETPAEVKEHSKEKVKQEPKLKTNTIKVGLAKPKTMVAEEMIKSSVKAAVSEEKASETTSYPTQPLVRDEAQPTAKVTKVTSSVKKVVTFEDMVAFKDALRKPATGTDLKAFLAK